MLWVFRWHSPVSECDLHTTRVFIVALMRIGQDTDHYPYKVVGTAEYSVHMCCNFVIGMILASSFLMSKNPLFVPSRNITTSEMIKDRLC